MVDAHSVDLFFVRNLAEVLPAWDRQPGRKVGNRRHDFGGIAGTEREVATGIEIAQRVIRSVAPLCAGVHLMALGWESHIPEILRGSGLRP